MDDNAGPVFRTKSDELRFNFIRAYNAWIAEKAKQNAFYSAIEAAWNNYCYHRDAWIFGVEYLEMTLKQKKQYMVDRSICS